MIIIKAEIKEEKKFWTSVIVRLSDILKLDPSGMSEGKTEYQLKSPPEDGISAVEFCPTSTNMLLVSSWDRTIRLYEVGKNEQ